MAPLGLGPVLVEVETLLNQLSACVNFPQCLGPLSVVLLTGAAGFGCGAEPRGYSSSWLHGEAEITAWGLRVHLSGSFPEPNWKSGITT